MRYDYAVYTGHWPFRKLRQGALSQVLEKYKTAGFSGGCVSSLDAVFYNDPWEADGPLLEALKGTGWEPAVCVDPTLPWWELRLREARKMGVRFARLYPGIHGYDIGDMEPLWKAAGELGVTLLLTARLEDERLCRLLNQGSVSIEACAAMAQKFPEVVTVLSGFYLHELKSLTLWPDNLWTDTSGLRHGPPEKHDDRTVFGSGFPLQCLESHLLNLPDAVKEQILSNSL